MALLDAAYIRATYPIASDFPAGPVTEAIALASETVKAFVGSDAYTDAGAGSPTDATRKVFLKAGEGRTVIYFLLLSAAAGTVRRQGIAKREQDAAGPMNGTVINEYYTPKEVQQLRDQFASDALSFLKNYQADDAVFFLDSGGIGVGKMRSDDLEEDIFLISDVIQGRF
jgi:hypothetical protein